MFLSQIWYSVLACLFFLPLLAKLLSRYVSPEDRLTLLEHWSPFMEIFLLEAPSVQYSTNPLRLLFGGWMLAALVLSSVANATLKSFMTVLTPTRRLETFEDVLSLDPTETRTIVTSGVGFVDAALQADFKPINEVGRRILQSNGQFNPPELGEPWMLRELETGKSVLILSCDVVTSSLYTSPKVKLQGTQGYTYCIKGILGGYYGGMVASRRADASLEDIFNELDKRVLWIVQSPFPLLLHYESRSPLIGNRYLDSDILPRLPPSSMSLQELSGTFLVYGVLVSFTIVIFIVESC